MARKSSIVHSMLAATALTPLILAADDVRDFEQLSRLGIHLTAQDVADMIEGMALDAAPDLGGPSMTAANVGAPVQFLQTWLPGFVQMMTAARKIDEILGVATIGAWDDEEIVQGIMEPAGLPQAYSDRAPVPLSSWNVNYEKRGIARFEMGMNVGRLEAGRAAKMKVDTAARKRAAAALALEILRNRVGFYGYNGGANRVYGFLNDPNLPAYSNVAAGVGGATWDLKTFDEITKDLREAANALRNASGDNIDPYTTKTTLAISTAKIGFFSVQTAYGQSVIEWVEKTFKGNMRIVSAPELNGANGGADVFVLFADRVEDGQSDDGGQTFMQMVPAKFLTLGAQQRVKDYVEDYSNALAGVMVKRPFAVIRRSGI